MAQFYICHNKHQDPLVTQLQFDEQHLDMIVAARYLSKAALKVSDIKTKLGLAKISQYLERMDEKMQVLLLNNKTTGKEEEKKSKLNFLINNFHDQNKENMQFFNQPSSFAKIQISKSQMTQCRRLQNNLQDKQKESLIDSLKWRQVVTKNTFDEPQKQNCKVKFNLDQEEDISSSKLMERKICERLEEESKILEKCIRNLFEFFSSKNLIQFNGKIEPNKCEVLCLMLSTNFQKQQQQNNLQLQNLFSKSVLLQQTIDNLNTNLSQYHQLHDKNNLHDQPAQTDFQLKQHAQLKEARKQLSESLQSNQKYEMMLYIKDEEIKSLKAIISDYENRLNKIAEIDNRSRSKSRSKSYKKFFEESGENLSSTVS